MYSSGGCPRSEQMNANWIWKLREMSLLHTQSHFNLQKEKLGAQQTYFGVGIQNQKALFTENGEIMQR